LTDSRNGDGSADWDEISLSGAVRIEDIAGTRIIGPYLSAPRGTLGIGAGFRKTDIGYDIQLLVYDPFPPPEVNKDCRYRLYTVRGNGSYFPEKIIFNETTPYTWDLKDHSSIPTTGQGDIDDNGYLDTVQGINTHPNLNDPMRPGLLRITFKFPNGSKECNFLGTDPRDSLGDCVIVQDINGDGKADILVGASGADGIANKRQGCGEIHIIMGKDDRYFPTSACIDEVSDHSIEGSNVQGSGYDDYNGDKIGRLFALSDMDGDGEKELIIANHLGCVIGSDGRVLRNAGWLSLFDIFNLISVQDSVAVLSHPSERLTIWAGDEGDSFGWVVSVADVNLDGFDDLLITSPYADGDDNMGPRCGEAYVVYGSGYRITGVSVKGTAVMGNEIYCCSGTSIWNMTFLDRSMGDDIINVDLELIGKNGRMMFSTDKDGTVVHTGNPDEVRIVSSKYSMGGVGKGSCELELYFNWSVPLKGPIDIQATLMDSGGNKSVRYIKGFVDIRKDMTLIGTPIIISDGIPIEETGGHALPGSKIEIDGIGVEFQGAADRSPDHESIVLQLESGETVIDSFPFGTDNIFHTVASNSSDNMMSISIVLPSEGPPGKSSPDLGPTLAVTVPVDLEDPLEPQSLTSRIVTEEDPDHRLYDIVYRWDNQIGQDGDPNGSGVKHYSMVSQGTVDMPVMEEGGLLATWFTDDFFLEPGYSYVERELSIDWGPWGPEPTLIPPTGYSVRWHGWLWQERTGDNALYFEGSGEVKVVIGNERVLDWTELWRNPSVQDLYLPGRKYVPIEIYYRTHVKDSKMTVEMEDTSGNWTTLGGKGTFFPSSSFNCTDAAGSEVSAVITSIDWTGRYSKGLTDIIGLDRTAPKVLLGPGPYWFLSEKSMINATIYDPGPTEGSEGQVDVKNITFRIWAQGGMAPEQWSKKGLVIQGSAGPYPFTTNISLKVEGYDGWKGFVQVKANDLMGNTGVSGTVPIGFDLSPPIIEITSPNKGKDVIEGSLNIQTKAYDSNGAGVDLNRMNVRVRTDGVEWEPWTTMMTTEDNGEVKGVFSIETFPSIVDVEAMCSDLAGWTGLSDIVSIEIVKRPENHPPLPVIASPLNGSRLDIRTLIILDATGTYDDGLGPFGKVHLTWTSNISGVIATGGRNEVRLVEGYHRITLYADDGAPGHNVSASVEIRVGLMDHEDISNDDDPNIQDDDIAIWVFFFTFIILFIAIGAGLFIWKKVKDIQ